MKENNNKIKEKKVIETKTQKVSWIKKKFKTMHQKQKQKQWRARERQEPNNTVLHVFLHVTEQGWLHEIYSLQIFVMRDTPICFYEVRKWVF